MIRVQMIRQDTSHPDRRRRHQGRASCEVAGRRFEAEGPAPIYKLTTLLWLHGHGGADFEVWDDVSPFGKPGELRRHFHLSESELRDYCADIMDDGLDEDGPGSASGY